MLGISRFGPLPVRIRLLPFMLVLGLSAWEGAPLALPTFVTPEFQEFFRLGGVLRLTLPTGKGGVVHLFVVYGYHEAEEDPDKLQLAGKLLRAVLAEAQVACIDQPLLITGDLNADPAVIPCLAKGISEGRLVGRLCWFSHGLHMGLL